MGEFIGVKVEGGKRLRKTMKAAGADMKDLSRLNKEAANIVVPVAKALAPVGDPRGGSIRNTIRAGATQKAGIIRAGNAKMPYGGMLHYGTPGGFTDSLGRAHPLKPQPWIAMAAKQTEPQWVDNYFEGLMKVLDGITGE
ncbi:HK97 gp10 family phage protein [Paenarthrobacter nicotinovorans]|uniref:HK97 gp10 family phage protein n=1 Tax=Paenarthrobacter nicotinovorans TaxID=29320 RepID=UPI00119E0532|nr:HK97 gp10 family phage protein [Paenarthrobacter nicotinovorans]